MPLGRVDSGIAEVTPLAAEAVDAPDPACNPICRPRPLRTAGDVVALTSARAFDKTTQVMPSYVLYFQTILCRPLAVGGRCPRRAEAVDHEEFGAGIRSVPFAGPVLPFAGPHLDGDRIGAWPIRLGGGDIRCRCARGCVGSSRRRCPLVEAVAQLTLGRRFAGGGGGAVGSAPREGGDSWLSGGVDVRRAVGRGRAGRAAAPDGPHGVVDRGDGDRDRGRWRSPCRRWRGS